MPCIWQMPRANWQAAEFLIYPQMRFAPLFILLFLALAAYGQERVAIINTVDDRDSIDFSDLNYLTNRLRETAVKVLPKSRYGVMTTESIVAFLGSEERAAKECREATCLADLGRKVSADYVAQARVGRFGSQLSIHFQLYNSKSGNLIDSFTGNSKDIYGLLTIIDENAPALFKQMEVEKPKVEELVVDKPELVKLEPEPVKFEPEKPKVEKSGRTSFWVALGLDILGAGALGLGINNNAKSKAYYKKGKEFFYKSQDLEEYPNEYLNMKNQLYKAKSAQTARNIFYATGGVLLLSGIAVHIWF